MVQKFKQGAYSENGSTPQLPIIIVGAVTEQAWCADLKVMLQAVIGRAHACSMGPRCECLSDYNEVIHIHTFLKLKGIIIRGG